MEFEELKKTWDEQNNKVMYSIDESALGKIVSRKKSGAIKRAQIMEIILIGANLIAGSMVLISRYIKGSDNVYAFLMGSIMVVTACILIYYRSNRRSNKPIYEESIYGDVEHGLSDAKYIMKMSRLSQYYFLMIGIIMILVLGFDNWLITLCAAAFVIFTLYASSWEHQWHVTKYKELEQLRNTLNDVE